jgi:hypothetical protein
MGAVLSWKNWAEQSGAVLGVSSSQGGLGARGMLTTQTQDVWRSNTWNSTTNAVIDADLGASRTVKLIAFSAPRDGVLPSSGATVAITASNISAGGTDALNLSAAAFTLDPWGIWGWKSSAGITARYIRITFVGTGSSSSSYIQLGRLWVGDALITQYSYGYGQTRSFRDPGVSSRAGITGIRYLSAGLPYRVERISFPILSQTESNTLMTAGSEVGTTKQVFFAREEEYLGEGLFGHFSDVPDVTRQLEDMWTTDFQIEEDA